MLIDNAGIALLSNKVVVMLTRGFSMSFVIVSSSLSGWLE